MTALDEMLKGKTAADLAEMLAATARDPSRWDEIAKKLRNGTMNKSSNWIRVCTRCMWGGEGPKDGQFPCPECGNKTAPKERLDDNDRLCLGMLPTDPFSDSIPYGVTNENA